MRTILSDAAVTAVSAGSAPFRGEFKPDTSMAALVGTSAKGKWKLTLTDGFNGDPGVLTGWALHIKPAP